MGDTAIYSKGWNTDHGNRTRTNSRQIAAIKAATALSGAASSRRSVKQRPKSVVRENRTLRSVGVGGGQPPPTTRWAPQQWASLVRCGLFGEDNISSSSKESGEPHASLRSKNLCGRYGPASPSSAVHAGRYPGTRDTADPVYKVARRGALPCSTPEMVARSE